MIVNLPELKAKYSYFKLDQDPALRKHIAADIRRFVLHDFLCGNHFSSSDGSDQSVKLEALADMIATKADGSFLWVSLVLEKLHASPFFNTQQAEESISQCPPDLYGVYYESLARVDPERRKDIVKSFHIKLAARRPLTVVEFQIALAVKSGHQSLEALQQAVEKELDHTTSYIRNVLGNLIRTTETITTLRHQSVKDFLLNRLVAPQDSQQQNHPEHSSDLRAVFRMSMNEAEETLVECCISFLNLEEFAEKRSDEDEEREKWEDSGLGALSVFD